MQLLGKPVAVAVVAVWCCGLVQTAPLAGPAAAVAGPRASPSPAFTPEVAAAMQAFLLEFNAQSALAAQFPDNPVGGQSAATFPVRPSPPPTAAPAPPTTLQARTGTVSADVRSSAPAALTNTIPEAYAQYHSLLAPPPAPTFG